MTVFMDLFPENYCKNSNSKCPNPKHKDDHPSFQINDISGYCHACGKSYDICDLVMFHDNCNFAKAKEILTQKYIDAKNVSDQQGVKDEKQPFAMNLKDWLLMERPEREILLYP